jgi:hypothetical protein
VFAVNLPVTTMAVGWGLSKGGDCSIDEDLFIVCAGMSGGYGRGGTTFGSAFLTGRSRDSITDDLLRHEKAHSYQWALFGPTVFPALYYANEASVGWLRDHRSAGTYSSGWLDSPLADTTSVSASEARHSGER